MVTLLAVSKRMRAAAPRAWARASCAPAGTVRGSGPWMVTRYRGLFDIIRNLLPRSVADLGKEVKRRSEAWRIWSFGRRIRRAPCPTSGLWLGGSPAATAENPKGFSGLGP